jgi:hypothetical protein
MFDCKDVPDKFIGELSQLLTVIVNLTGNTDVHRCLPFLDTFSFPESISQAKSPLHHRHLSSRKARDAPFDSLIETNMTYSLKERKRWRKGKPGSIIFSFISLPFVSCS